MRVFCEMNPTWLRTVNHVSWATVRSCEIRVIATQPDVELSGMYWRDHMVRHGRHGLPDITIGRAPTPIRGTRGRFLQRKLELAPGAYWSQRDTMHVPVTDVGFDTLNDLKWSGTGGVRQNIILDEGNESINKTHLFGLMSGEEFEASSDEYSTDDSASRTPGDRLLLSEYKEYRADGSKELRKSLRLVEGPHGAYWTNISPTSQGRDPNIIRTSPIKDGDSQGIRFFKTAFQQLKKFGEIVDTADSLGLSAPGNIAVNQDDAEDAISLDASNNLSTESEAR